MPAHYSLALIDDHAVMRQALATLIEALGPYKVALQYNNGQELLDALPFAQPPDLLLLDLMMPVMGGAEVMRRMRAMGLSYRVLVLTNEVDAGHVLELVRLGARGYLPKACTAPELRIALEGVLHTGYYHSELEHATLIAEREHIAPTSPHFTPREIEFIRLTCHRDEHSYKVIAGLMQVSPRTVDGYRETVFAKCGVKTKVGLVFYALQHRLVLLPEL